MARTGSIKSVVVVGGLISALGFAIYPVIIKPKLHPKQYSKCDFFVQSVW